MARKVISSPDAPAAIGPYSQAVSTGGRSLLFCSGQIPLDTNGNFIGGDDVRLQTEQVMRNLAAVLAAGGCGFADVVKATIFCTDLGDFAAINEVYARSFDGVAPPARATVQARGCPRAPKSRSS